MITPVSGFSRVQAEQRAKEAMNKLAEVATVREEPQRGTVITLSGSVLFATGQYTLGFGLIDLAGVATGVTMVRAAKAVLKKIAARTGETTALSVMRDGRLVFDSTASAT